MKKVNFILIFVFFYSFMVAQNAQTIQFDNFEPVWSYYSNSISENIYTQAYQAERPLIDGDNIYFLHNLIGSHYQGHLTEKVDLNNGELKWNFEYISDQQGSREYGQPLSIDSVGNLTLLSFRERGRWPGAEARKMVLNPDSGLILDSFSRSGVAYLLSIQNSGVADVYSSLTPFKGNIRYFEHRRSSVLFFQRVYLLDSWGKRFDSKTNIKYFSDRYSHKSIGDFEIDSEKRIVLNHSSIREEFDSIRIDLLLLSNDLDTLQNFSIAEIIEPADSYSISDANSDQFIVKSTLEKYNGIYRYESNVFYRIDMTGNLLEKISIENTDGLLKYDSGMAKLLPEKGQMLIVYSSEEDGIQTLEFLRTNGAGNIESKKQLKSISSDDYFSIQKMFFLDDGDHILFNLHHRSNASFDIYAEKSVWMKLSIDELGLFVANKDLYVEVIGFNVYPNPTSGFLTFEFPEAIIPKNICIHDLFGREVAKMDFKHQIDIQYLQKGLYLILLSDEEGNVYSIKKVVLN